MDDATHALIVVEQGVQYFCKRSGLLERVSVGGYELFQGPYRGSVGGRRGLG